jgi:hypothetical protein
MALLLAKSRAYPQSPSALNAEAQEARFKENSNWKKIGGRNGRKCYWLVFRTLQPVWFFTVENGLLFPRR